MRTNCLIHFPSVSGVKKSDDGKMGLFLEV